MRKKTTEKKSAEKKPVTMKPAAEKKEIKKAESKISARREVFGLHNLKCPAGSMKKRKIVGRGPGSGHGKTSTRGSKGQTSRSGRDFYLGFEGGQSPLIRRMPKRGFNSRRPKVYQIVNIRDLDRIKETTISLGVLEDNGLIRDKNKLVKILGDGEVTKQVIIHAHAFSKNAVEKITKAGGKVEIVNDKCAA